MSHREEAPGKTQDTLERLCLSAGLGTPRVPLEELEEVSGVNESLKYLKELEWTRPLPLVAPPERQQQQRKQSGYQCQRCAKRWIGGMKVEFVESLKRVDREEARVSPSMLMRSHCIQRDHIRVRRVKLSTSGQLQESEGTSPQYQSAAMLPIINPPTAAQGSTRDYNGNKPPGFAVFTSSVIRNWQRSEYADDASVFNNADLAYGRVRKEEVRGGSPLEGPPPPTVSEISAPASSASRCVKSLPLSGAAPCVCVCGGHDNNLFLVMCAVDGEMDGGREVTKRGMVGMERGAADRDGTGRGEEDEEVEGGLATYAAVLSRPVDHRLVVGRIPFEHERTAEKGHLFFPGQRSPEAGRALLLTDRRYAWRGAPVFAAHVKRTVLPAAPA
ncbi:hypothetical protein L3Q82_017066 [Scortum barcoo]|uniref:Uncharacterized protein n=1 Tax=Scortum barcoo TaxID=214431 RepID=A0ACB8XA94_9TELE|nr:hypothetical protein L3Q82_017066 [Scortum barcoo]